MRQPLYIHAVTAISPQHSFGDDAGLETLASSDNGRLYVQDADYRAYINPVAIRRMSRSLKMSIAAAMRCLQEAGWDCPDAIITGTGRGSMGDMETFLKDMIRLEETALNPTYFIQSTYNSPNGWIALQTKSNGYNQTFVHRGHSLELALLDAQLLLAEGAPQQRILAGCYDELSDEYFHIKAKIGYWKVPSPPSLALLENGETPGTIGGEGSAFLAISGESAGATMRISGLELLQDADGKGIHDAVRRVLADNNIGPDDIDAVLCGKNGDLRQDGLYAAALAEFAGTCVLSFKNLCGEYDTSSGFALWLAGYLMKGGTVPAEIVVAGDCAKPLQRILLVNHYILGSGTVMLLEGV